MFRLNPFVRVGLCLSAISCAWPVLAVDDDGETMVVTASSVEQNLKDTQEDLQRKPVQNLKDVLKEVPGVQLTNEGDNRKGVSIRGLDSSYTLILVDGKRVNSRNAVFRDFTQFTLIPCIFQCICQLRRKKSGAVVA